MLARRPGHPAAVPPLRLEGELLHLGIVRPLPPSRARPEIPEMGIAGETAPPPGQSRSCPDCLAWGVTARYGWMCVACKSWREKYGTDGQCATCGRSVPVSPDGSCRLCHKHRNLAARLLGRRIETVSLAEANAHGQQLFIAGTWRPAGTIRREYVKKTVPADMSLLRPVAHRQLVLFDMPRDLRAGAVGQVPAAPGPGTGGRVRPVRPRPRRRARLDQGLYRHHPARASGSCSASRTPPARRSAAATSCC